MKLVLFLLSILEILLVSYFRNIAGIKPMPVLLLSVSTSIAFVFLYLSNHKKSSLLDISLSVNSKKIISILQITGFISLSILIANVLNNYCKSYIFTKDKAEWSDIIPQIMFMVDRTLHHTQPYVPITSWGYSLFPTYLPLQWLPYVIAEKLNIDYRWIAALFLWLASLHFFLKNLNIQKLHLNNILQVVIPLWPLIIWLTLMKHDKDLFIISVESLVAGYYLFTATAIYNKNILSLAIGISLCLLSRYSIIFWVPVCLSCLYFSGYKKQALFIACTFLLFFAVFYWIPFLSNDPSIFLHGYQYHTKAAIYEWWRKMYLINNLGFASWGGKYLPGIIDEQLNTFKLIHLVICIGIAFFCILLYKFNRHKYSLKPFLLFSLKLYLSFFYAFIQIPYTYLFIVPVMISAVILMSACCVQETPFRNDNTNAKFSF